MPSTPRSGAAAVGILRRLGRVARWVGRGIWRTKSVWGPALVGAGLATWAALAIGLTGGLALLAAPLAGAVVGALMGMRWKAGQSQRRSASREREAQKSSTQGRLQAPATRANESKESKTPTDLKDPKDLEQLKRFEEFQKRQFEQWQRWNRPPPSPSPESRLDPADGLRTDRSQSPPPLMSRPEWTPTPPMTPPQTRRSSPSPAHSPEIAAMMPPGSDPGSGAGEQSPDRGRSRTAKKTTHTSQARGK